MTTPEQPLYKAIGRKLDELTPNQWFLVPTGELGSNPKRTIRNIRAQVGRTNSFAHLNIRVHSSHEGVWIWHDPTPKMRKAAISPQFAKLIALQQQHKDAQVTGDNEQAQILAKQIVDTLVLLQDAKQSTMPKQKGAITMPLDAVLTHLGTTKNVWDLMNPREQLAWRIKAQVEMKRAREAKAIEEPNNT